MAGIVQYESGWKPYAIGDNTTRHSYYTDSKVTALNTEITLLGMGHNIDVGLAQVNSDNFAAYGLTPLTTLNPCTNVHAGATILAGNYARAVQTNWTGAPIRTSHDVYLQQQYALVHSLSAYNTGGFFAGMGYAHNVYQIAESVRIDFPYAPAINEAPTAAYEPVLHAARKRAARTVAIIKQVFRPIWTDLPTQSAIKVLLSKSSEDK